MSIETNVARPIDPGLETLVTLLHLKDTKHVSKGVHDLASTDAGTGIVKWDELVELVRASRSEHMFVEQEEPFPTTPMDAARNDYAFLTRLFASGGAAPKGAKP